MDMRSRSRASSRASMPARTAPSDELAARGSAAGAHVGGARSPAASPALSFGSVDSLPAEMFMDASVHTAQHASAPGPPPGAHTASGSEQGGAQGAQPHGAPAADAAQHAGVGLRGTPAVLFTEQVHKTIALRRNSTPFSHHRCLRAAPWLQDVVDGVLLVLPRLHDLRLDVPYVAVHFGRMLGRCAGSRSCANARLALMPPRSLVREGTVSYRLLALLDRASAASAPATPVAGAPARGRSGPQSPALEVVAQVIATALAELQVRASPCTASPACAHA